MSSDFMIFAASLIIVLIILVATFGGDMMESMMYFMYTPVKEQILEEAVTCLTVAAYSPGDAEIEMKVKGKHSFDFGEENDYCFLKVDDLERMTFPCAGLDINPYRGETKENQDHIIVSEKLGNSLSFNMRGVMG